MNKAGEIVSLDAELVELSKHHVNEVLVAKFCAKTAQWILHVPCTTAERLHVGKVYTFTIKDAE